MTSRSSSWWSPGQSDWGGHSEVEAGKSRVSQEAHLEQGQCCKVIQVMLMLVVVMVVMVVVMVMMMLTISPPLRGELPFADHVIFRMVIFCLIEFLQQQNPETVGEPGWHWCDKITGKTLFISGCLCIIFHVIQNTLQSRISQSLENDILKGFLKIFERHIHMHQVAAQEVKLSHCWTSEETDKSFSIV